MTLEVLKYHIARMQVAYDQFEAPMLAAQACAKDFVHEWDAYPPHLLPFRSLNTVEAIEKSRRTLAKNIYRTVVSLVGEHFAVAGTAVSLDEEGEIRDQLIGDKGVVDSFGPTAVLNALLDRYGATAEADGMRQIADAFVAAFRLRPGDAVKTVSGHVVLSFTMYECTIARTFGKKRYTSDDDITTAIAAMAAVLAVVMPRDAAERVRAESSRSRQPREWVPGENPAFSFAGISLRTFKQKVEFRIPQDMAASINTFVAAHSTMPDRAAA